MTNKMIYFKVKNLKEVYQELQYLKLILQLKHKVFQKDKIQVNMEVVSLKLVKAHNLQLLK